MLVAGILIIDKHGKDNVSLLFPIFENYLNKKVSLCLRFTFFLIKIFLRSIFVLNG